MTEEMIMAKPRFYAYFFTRQDMIPEQQIVQTAHAAHLMGASYASVDNKSTVPFAKNDPRETYFTLVGVRNLEALEGVRMILDKFGYKYEAFVEPDMGGEITSIALYPINENDRGPLMAFNLLRIAKV